VVLLGGQHRNGRLRARGGGLTTTAGVKERSGTEREDDQAQRPVQRGVRSA
jgi:hypothetical protein